MSELLQMLSKALIETLYMVVVSTVFSYIFGLPLGVLLNITEKNGLYPAPKLNAVVGFGVNMVRSVPFLILMITIIPVTRLIAGSPIGPTAAIVPLVISATPLIARVTQATLSNVDSGVVEAAKSMGASNMQIITKVMIGESMPSLVQDFTISATTILGYSSMAGLLGGGGLGDLAIRFGYYKYEVGVMLVTVVVLVILVQIMGISGEKTAFKLDKRKK